MKVVYLDYHVVTQSYLLDSGVRKYPAAAVIHVMLLWFSIVHMNMVTFGVGLKALSIYVGLMWVSKAFILFSMYILYGGNRILNEWYLSALIS